MLRVHQVVQITYTSIQKRHTEHSFPFGSANYFHAASGNLHLNTLHSFHSRTTRLSNISPSCINTINSEISDLPLINMMIFRRNTVIKIIILLFFALVTLLEMILCAETPLNIVLKVYTENKLLFWQYVLHRRKSALVLDT